jgi:cytochrome bd-type quinol oxidase subunit 2
MSTINSEKDDLSNTVNTFGFFDKWFPTFCKLMGGALIVLAGASYATNMTLFDLLSYVEQIFSYTFVALFVPLVLCATYAITFIHREHESKAKKIFWYEVGQQSANGISTLALTFTLLGISVGIGTMSKQSLTPESVNQVIVVLTQQFSMAFMTTIVGLPTATLCRALLSIGMTKPFKPQQEYIAYSKKAQGTQDGKHS